MNNPIIADHSVDTLHNVACILSFLQGATSAQALAKQPLAERDWLGLHIVMGAAEHALACEAERVSTNWASGQMITHK